MHDEDGTPMFAFQHLDYVPFGFSGSTAPYIETGPGTMRAAATLMGLDAQIGREALNTVVCDLGCGDGQFRTDNLCIFRCYSRNGCLWPGAAPRRNEYRLIKKNHIKSSAC
jgi:hypothetical protein